MTALGEYSCGLAHYRRKRKARRRFAPPPPPQACIYYSAAYNGSVIPSILASALPIRTAKYDHSDGTEGEKIRQIQLREPPHPAAGYPISQTANSSTVCRQEPDRSAIDFWPSLPRTSLVVTYALAWDSDRKGPPPPPPKKKKKKKEKRKRKEHPPTQVSVFRQCTKGSGCWDWLCRCNQLR